MADLNADAVREQMARAWWIHHFGSLGSWPIETPSVRERWLGDVAVSMPIAVRAVTDVVRELHKPEKRWQSHPDADWSCETPEEALAFVPTRSDGATGHSADMTIRSGPAEPSASVTRLTRPRGCSDE